MFAWLSPLACLPFLHIIADSNCDESIQTAVQVQLAVITLEVALAALWAICGIKPAMVTGHSLASMLLCTLPAFCR